jgi:hypothetical protein
MYNELPSDMRHFISGARVIPPNVGVWPSGGFVSHISRRGTSSSSAHWHLWYVGTRCTLWWHTYVLGDTCSSCSVYFWGSPHAGICTVIVELIDILVEFQQIPINKKQEFPMHNLKGHFWELHCSGLLHTICCCITDILGWLIVPSLRFKVDMWPFKMGVVHCPRAWLTSEHTLYHNTEDLRSHLHHGESLNSHEPHVLLHMLLHLQMTWVQMLLTLDFLNVTVVSHCLYIFNYSFTIFHASGVLRGVVWGVQTPSKIPKFWQSTKN